MPYAPAVTDRSGEIRAQGMQQGFQSLADSFRQFAQNQAMTKTAIGKFQGALAADPSMLQLFSAGKAPTEAQAAFQKLQTKGSLAPKDAAMLSMFADAFTDQKKQQAQIQLQQQQAQIQQMQMEEARRRLSEDSVRRSQLEAFSNLQRGVGTGVYSRGVQSQTKTLAQNPFFRQAAQIQQATGDMPTADALLEQSTRGTAAPTTAMRDTEAIIYSELAAGKLKPGAVESRKAELLAAGGRDPGSRYDNAGTYVDLKTGSDARAAVKDRNTGQIGFVGQDGKFDPIDPKAWKPSTVSDTNALLDPPAFEKLREKTLSDERAIRRLQTYLGGFDDLRQGAGQLADRVSKHFTTLFTKEPLTSEEKAVGVQTGRLQQIIGGLRTTIVGPGVMTEQDAQRIVDGLGGKVDTLTNPEVVKALIAEILEDKIAEYDAELDIYNTHVVRKYGSQGGWKQMKRVPITYKDAPTNVGGAWTKTDAERLEALRKKRE